LCYAIFMKKNKIGFSLIEVVIAAGILSVTVFGVYKLIGENSKLINNSDNYLTLNNLFIPLQECIKSKNISGYSGNNIWDIINFNFWVDFDKLDECNKNIWWSNLVKLNNIEYNLVWEIISKNSDSINWKLEIKAEWVWSKEIDFLQYE